MGFNYSFGLPSEEEIEEILDNNSGATFFTGIKVLPKKGYIVGLKPNKKLEPQFANDPDCNPGDYSAEDEIFGFVFDEGNAYHYTSDIIDVIEEMQARGHTGIWVDKGNVYLENVKIIPEFEPAVKLAKRTRQIAIYDIANEKELYYDKEEFTYK